MSELTFNSEAELCAWARGLWESGFSIRRIGYELRRYGRTVPLLSVTHWLTLSGLDRLQVLREEAPRQFHEDAPEDLTTLSDIEDQLEELQKRADLPEPPRSIKAAIHAAVHRKHLIMWKLVQSGLLPLANLKSPKKPVVAKSFEEPPAAPAPVAETPAPTKPAEPEQPKPAVTVPVTNAVTVQKIARNGKCPCGSTQKYKKCCGDPTKAKPTGTDSPPAV